MLINLTKYALKQTHNGQITIKACFNYEQNMLQVHIMNTGKGISQTKQQKLLKVLAIQQNKYNSNGINNGGVSGGGGGSLSSASSKREQELLGLSMNNNNNESDGEGDIEFEFGLLTSKKILQCSGGMLDIHSDGEGRGSTFAFNIRMELPKASNSSALSTISEESKIAKRSDSVVSRASTQKKRSH